LSNENKGGFPIYHLEQVTEMGVELVPCIITCYFFGCFNTRDEMTLFRSPGNIPQLQFSFALQLHSLIYVSLPCLLETSPPHFEAWSHFWVKEHHLDKDPSTRGLGSVISGTLIRQGTLRNIVQSRS
jgi:hypothetical protein